MLQHVHDETARETDRRDLGSALARVQRDIADILTLWPGPAAAGGLEPMTRFSTCAEGKLIWVSGGRRRAPPAGPVEGRAVYAVGDVHGCYDLLLALLARVGRDAAGRPALTLILLGDYVDRGPDSARVLEALCALKARARFDVCLLKGNHEEALLQFLDAPAKAAPWLGFGGRETLQSYGVEPPSLDDPPERYVEARDALLRRMPAAHLRLLQTLDTMAIVGDYAFVHAGVAPGEPLRKQRARDLLWIRREFLNARGPFEKVIVHGHTWEDDRPVVTSTRIGLDTGAYETGVLGAMRFEKDACAWLHVRDPERPPWRGRGVEPPSALVAAPLDFTQSAAQSAWGPVVDRGPGGA